MLSPSEPMSAVQSGHVPVVSRYSSPAQQLMVIPFVVGGCRPVGVAPAWWSPLDSNQAAAGFNRVLYQMS